jgi:segregation and condensation protein B
MTEVHAALEALIFAAGDPIHKRELQRALGRDDLDADLDALEAHWRQRDHAGFRLVQVAGGYAFRTEPRFASMLQAMQAERPQRWTRAALETLSIVAYRQPITKPEIDHLRGVDCAGVLRLLLQRNMLRIVGKRDEPGRPILYGTTQAFLSFFNLNKLSELPSLREVQELGAGSRRALDAFERESIHTLQQSARPLSPPPLEPLADLDEAMGAVPQ